MSFRITNLMVYIVDGLDEDASIDLRLRGVLISFFLGFRLMFLLLSMLYWVVVCVLMRLLRLLSGSGFALPGFSWCCWSEVVCCCFSWCFVSCFRCRGWVADFSSWVWLCVWCFFFFVGILSMSLYGFRVAFACSCLL